MENNNLHPQVPSTQEVEHDSQTSISQLPSEPTSLDDFSKKRKIIFSLVFIFIAASVAIVSFFAYNTFQESKKKAPSFDLNPTFVPENPEDKQVNDPVRQKETDQVLFYTDFTNLWRFNPNDLSRKKVTNQQIVWRHPLRVSPDGEKILATISFPTDKPPITTAILGVIEVDTGEVILKIPEAWEDGLWYSRDKIIFRSNDQKLKIISLNDPQNPQILSEFQGRILEPVDVSPNRESILLFETKPRGSENILLDRNIIIFDPNSLTENIILGEKMNFGEKDFKLSLITSAKWITDTIFAYEVITLDASFEQSVIEIFIYDLSTKNKLNIIRQQETQSITPLVRLGVAQSTQQIIYAVGSEKTEGQNRILLYDLKGQETRELAVLDRGYLLSVLSVSPDGKWLAYETSKTDSRLPGSPLYILEIGSKKITKVCEDGCYSPVWKNE